MIEVVPATRAHAEAIRLRDGDARELEALGMTMVEAFDVSMTRAAWADAWLIDGEVAALVGVSVLNFLGGEGCPWLLTGRPVDRHRKLFLRETRRGVDRMRAEFPVLRNHVHAEYDEALRWMAWLGFRLGAPVPLGPHNAPFCPATMGQA